MVAFPRYNEIAADKAVQTFTRQAWKLTLSLANPKSGREVGFWIWLDTCKGGGYGHTKTVIPREPTTNDAVGFVTNRTVPTLVADIDHRDHAIIELVIRDLKDQQSTLPLPLRPLSRQRRMDRDRRRRAQPRPLDNPDRLAHRARPNRPLPPASPIGDPGPVDAHQPPMDPTTSSPLAVEDRLHHRAGRDPGAPRPNLTALTPVPSPPS